MRFIWATRGKHWGFRFLRTGGFSDPLPAYDAAFASLSSTAEAWGSEPGWVALRFPDPDGRKDAAGRIISHEFVVFAPDSEGFASFADARSTLWAEVAGEFEQCWSLPEG